MRVNPLRGTLAALGIALAAVACGEGSSGSLGGAGGTMGGNPSSDPNTNNPGPGGTPTKGQNDNANNPNNNGGMGGGNGGSLDARVINYGEAMRTASLKLVGSLPTLDEIKGLEAAADKKVFYEQKLDAYLADPRFASKMIQWWRDTLRAGGPAAGMRPSFETAATFAAMVVVQDRPYTDLFTATTGTCPTFNNGAFQAANCANNAPTTGILTDPGLMAQYAANMAFRRVRFVQETFVCSKFPTEFGQNPQQMGSGTYTSPWPFQSITGGQQARINFQDTSSVICANCHTTMNHIAPLFANFNDNGMYTNTIQVRTPSQGNPITTMNDWLPQGQQQLAWRMGTPVTDLPSLGQAVAKDPDVARCAVNRVWNWAMSRADIVNDLATVPNMVTDPIVTDFTQNGLKLKRVIRNVFTSDDFVKF